MGSVVPQQLERKGGGPPTGPFWGLHSIKKQRGTSRYTMPLGHQCEPMFGQVWVIDGPLRYFAHIYQVHLFQQTTTYSHPKGQMEKIAESHTFSPPIKNQAVDPTKQITTLLAFFCSSHAWRNFSSASWYLPGKRAKKVERKSGSQVLCCLLVPKLRFHS